MKIKFIKGVIGFIICLILFLVTMFVPSVKALHKADFFQGVTAGAATGAFIASIVYYLKWKKGDEEVPEL